MLSILPLIFLAVALPATEEHTIGIRITGSVAVVDVSRRIEPAGPVHHNIPKETAIDLALPEGSVFLDGGFEIDGRRTPLLPVNLGRASAVYAQAVAQAKTTTTTVSPDDGADARIRILGLRSSAILRYRYATIITCAEGRFVLRFPASLEEQPVPAKVSLSITGLQPGQYLASAQCADTSATVSRNVQRFQVTGVAPSRAAWEVSWSLTTVKKDTLDSTVLSNVLSTHTLATAQQPAWQAVTICRDHQKLKPERPRHALFLLDQSASVGRGSIFDEQVLARAIARGLPPNVLLNAIRFHREATPLFPRARMATNEVLESIGNSLDPNQLANGTDLAVALLRAKPHLSSEESPDGPRWLIIITDGDVPADLSAQGMRQALGGMVPPPLRVLVLFVRQNGDDEVPIGVRKIFADFVESYGGLVRAVPAGNPEEIAREIVLAMEEGGDLLNLRTEHRLLSESIRPGQGKTYFWTGSKPARRLEGRIRDGRVARRIVPALLVDRVQTLPSDRKALLGQENGMTIVLIPETPVHSDDGITRGQMDPQVLRNTLSLAFMPRARACYLSRRVQNARDASLRGRVKLELTLSRGELHDAVVRSSTLEHPQIEACLQQAARAIEYPRPEHRDALTVANINLVFRPRTTEEINPDASVIDREIELILGPLQFPGGESSLLLDVEKKPAGSP
jgi:hypothetical protein